MYTRREWLGVTLGTGAALALQSCGMRPAATSAAGRNLLTRAIPSTGEMVPLVGLGSSATFSRVARTEDHAALREVLRTMVDTGATVFDTAPSYGASEEVAGAIAQELAVFKPA